MIVDDHWIVREGLFVSLNRHSRLRVVGTASSGEEAIVAAPRLAPDLIIMDVVLPGLDGIDAAQRILREAPQIHVIVLSACRSFEQVQRALRAGIGAYVLKAAAFEEIVLAVESVLSGRQYVSPAFQALLVGGLAEAAMPPFMSSHEVESNESYSKGQHRGNIGEGQLHLNEQNIHSFDRYLTDPKDLESAMRETFKRQTTADAGKGTASEN